MYTTLTSSIVSETLNIMDQLDHGTHQQMEDSSELSQHLGDCLRAAQLNQISFLDFCKESWDVLDKIDEFDKNNQQER